MKARTFRLALLAAAMAAGGAQAATTCSISATAPNVIFTGAVNNSSGTFSVTCTRDTNINSLELVTVYIGVSPAAGAGRRLMRHGGGNGNGDRLDASLFKNGTTTNLGDASSGERISSTMIFWWGTATNTVTLDYDFRLPNQAGKAAGIYSAVYTANLRLSANGGIESSTVFSPTASVPEQCFVGQVPSGNEAPGAISPGNIVLNYNSFATTAQTASTNFTVDCTLNTDYTLSITPANGTLLGLNYNLRLNNGQATWTGLNGNGFAQPYSVTATIPPNQAGTCATATCTAKQAATLTVTY